MRQRHVGSSDVGQRSRERTAKGRASGAVHQASRVGRRWTIEAVALHGLSSPYPVQLSASRSPPLVSRIAERLIPSHPRLRVDPLVCPWPARLSLRVMDAAFDLQLVRPSRAWTRLTRRRASVASCATLCPLSSAQSYSRPVHAGVSSRLIDQRVLGPVAPRDVEVLGLSFVRLDCISRLTHQAAIQDAETSSLVDERVEALQRALDNPRGASAAGRASLTVSFLEKRAAKKCVARRFASLAHRPGRRGGRARPASGRGRRGRSSSSLPTQRTSEVRPSVRSRLTRAERSRCASSNALQLTVSTEDITRGQLKRFQMRSLAFVNDRSQHVPPIVTSDTIPHPVELIVSQ